MEWYKKKLKASAVSWKTGNKTILGHKSLKRILLTAFRFHIDDRTSTKRVGKGGTTAN
jgi:hypothetical protein